MLVTLKYFGQIAEVTQKEEEKLEVSGNTVSELLKQVFAKYAALENKDFQIAQNQELVTLETILSGDEIALLPPFAGG